MALEVERVLAEEAKERQGERNDLKAVEGNNIVEKIPQCEPESKSREKAASIIGNTNARYVQDAKKIEREAPEVKELVMAGTVNMADAVKLTKLEPDKRAVAVERRVYLYGRLPRGARPALREIALLSSRQNEISFSDEIMLSFSSSVIEPFFICASSRLNIKSLSSLGLWDILGAPVR